MLTQIDQTNDLRTPTITSISLAYKMSACVLRAYSDFGSEAKESKFYFR